MKETLGEVRRQEKHPFPVGTKYLFQDREWIVKRAWQDGGTQFRFVTSHQTGEENYMELHILQKDAQSPDFTFLELTDKERLFLKAQKLL